MKITPKKNRTANNINRVSALARVNKPMSRNRNNNNNNNKQVHRRLTAPAAPIITDARQLLTSRTTPIFDARQLLSRQSSKTLNVSTLGQTDFMQIEADHYDGEQNFGSVTSSDNGRFVSGNRDISIEKKVNTFITVQNPDAIESIPFVKTITNKVLHGEDDDDQLNTIDTQLSSSDRKFNISFVNDQYKKRSNSPCLPPPSPPPVIRRLQDASIQTAYSPPVSQSSNRINSHQRHSGEHDNSYEPFTKRNTSRTTTREIEKQHSSTAPKSSLKSSSTDTSASKRFAHSSVSKSDSDGTTILITNLQSTVTEDDILELFGEVGHIEQIKTLSRGCVQVVYSRQEYAENAVAKYHNQVLDGQFIYVSLQQPSSRSSKHSSSSRHSDSKRAKTQSSSTSSPPTNESESSKAKSNKIIIDPTFMRQALFNPSNNTANPVQFQVKL